VFPATGAIFTQNEVNIGIYPKISLTKADFKIQNRWSTRVSKTYVLRNRNVRVSSEHSKVPESPEIKVFWAGETLIDPTHFLGRVGGRTID
jgi:hypothetical protein